jgi:aromatic ring-opening dioxygenase catalytic subunit (LigB family)
MSLVFAGVCSHAPGITGRAHLADAAVKDEFHKQFHRMGEQLEASKPDAVIVIAAEHFANFFMNNMPAYAIGMADHYEGPIEDPKWLGIEKRRIPGNAALSQRLIREVMQTVDVAYAEEWKFDHGIMVPLHFLTPKYDKAIIPVNINCQGPPLTPLHRAWAFGEALRRACDKAPERIALVGTGGISHWPATPDSGKVNEAWDREFLDRWVRNDKDAMLSYSDEATYREAGQGGFEIRTFLSVAAAARGRGEVLHFKPIPIFAVSCTAATMSVV